MDPFYSDKDYVLYNGDMLEVLDDMQPNSIDSIVTDPPYEIDFMNKSWDSTGKAVMFENKERNAKYRFIGIELNETYTQISKERINYALHKQEIDETNLKKRLKDKGILTIYDFIGDEKK